jgi:hypothetical protein
MNWLKTLLTGINPWLPVFAFVTLFHVIRESYVDALIFAIGAVILILDWKRFFHWPMPSRPAVKQWVVAVAIAVSSSVLFFSERGGWQDVLLLLAIGPAALFLVYYRDHGPKPSGNGTMVRTKWIWMALAIFMAVSELFAYIWAVVFRDSSTYPTISIIVNPILDSPYGRSIFLVLWMLIGLGLLRNGRKT